jgi:hypothetical protein
MPALNCNRAGWSTFILKKSVQWLEMTCAILSAILRTMALYSFNTIFQEFTARFPVVPRVTQTWTVMSLLCGIHQHSTLSVWPCGNHTGTLLLHFWYQERRSNVYHYIFLGIFFPWGIPSIELFCWCRRKVFVSGKHLISVRERHVTLSSLDPIWLTK